MKEHKHQKVYIQLGLNISYYRKKQNLTQEQLAELAKISRTHISNIEAAMKIPSLELLLTISDVLNISIEKLFENR